ncbi:MULTISPECIES: RAMP superfamily CRISPR-associated protein [Rodentibacter]|uniref:RAMP superfamily CRISPR-associated protein n=1 Tax=Rodentibacter TaxID=1960084 RepID=UPI001CFE7ACD|nr:RAMP superfamily CRISPR-associated protein [Rodentibacter sp. JRC1]GJI56752.1 hypothetical protein HEMROJRC1_18640 [Rodentibacter sp. JRC1]
MDKFLQHHRVYLTPLTPIHIGCGEDFEPTNYVIDEGVLYHFEPSKLWLDDSQRSQLLGLAQKSDLGEIQKFFQRNKIQAVNFAHYFANVASGVAQDWETKIGKPATIEGNGLKVFNQFAIERHCYSPYENLPYIPASSFKGALATALLDDAHQKRGNPRIDKRDKQKLIEKDIGLFADSLLRTVKFADFKANSTAYTQICYSTNHKKKVSSQRKEARGVALRRECIVGGQYRAFESELAIVRKDKFATLQNIFDYLNILNKFSRSLFDKEMALLVDRQLMEREQAQSLKLLVEKSSGILVRLGKSGAESKSYRGDNVAQIKIMKGGKDGKDDYRDQATTLWLASSTENAKSRLLPFGWALLEVDPTEENVMLKQWCEKQPKSLFDKQAHFENQQREKNKRIQEEMEYKAKKEAELQAELDKLALLESLNENQKSVMDLVAKFESGREKQFDTHSSLFVEVKKLIGTAIESWNESDKQFTYQQLTLEFVKTRVEMKKKNADKEYNKLRNRLIG